MVIDSVAGRVVHFLPWGQDGVPQRIVEEPEPGGALGGFAPRADWVATMTSANIRLRVLPDGGTQLSAPIDGGVRLIRLGSRMFHRDIPSGVHVSDAVLFEDESAILLEGSGLREYAVRRVDAGGSTIWDLDSTPDRDSWPEVDIRSKLLMTGPERVLLSNYDSLLRIDDGSAECLYRWKRLSAVAYPDGRVGYTRHHAGGGGYDYVTIDLANSSETVLTSTHHTVGLLLAQLIGVDGDDRVYGFQTERMSPGGELEWSASVTGIVVSDDLQVTMQTHPHEHDRDRRVIRIGELTIDMTDHVGYLIGRNADGSYLLRQPATRHRPDLVHTYDSQGRYLRSVPSPDDVALAYFVTQHVTHSSVTKDGEVLVVVKGPAGVYVVGLRPTETDA